MMIWWQDSLKAGETPDLLVTGAEVESAAYSGAALQGQHVQITGHHPTQDVQHQLHGQARDMSSLNHNIQIIDSQQFPIMILIHYLLLCTTVKITVKYF